MGVTTSQLARAALQLTTPFCPCYTGPNMSARLASNWWYYYFTFAVRVARLGGIAA